MLRFLCDEVLNSALIREHLEQCVDKSNIAQQKLYALTIDWRNLKYKEELLARNVRGHTGKPSGDRDSVGKEGAAMQSDQGMSIEQQQHFSNRVIYTTNFSGSPLKRASAPLEEYCEDNGQTGVNQNFGQLLKSMIDKHVNANKPQTHHSLPDSMAVEHGTHSVDGHLLSKATINGHPRSIINISNSNELNGQEHSVVPSQLGNAAVGGVVAKSAINSLDVDGVPIMGENGTVQLNTDILHGSQPTLDCARTHCGENTFSMTISSGASISGGGLHPSHQNAVLQGSCMDVPASLTDFEANNLEVNSLRNEISHVQDSIANLESQVMFTSLRRDFLGRDSIGRLYWVIGKPGKRPWLVVGGSMLVPLDEREATKIGTGSSNSICGFASSSYVLCRNTFPSFSQSNCNLNCSVWNSSPLVLYESDSEIEQLVSWLSEADPRERELKECIMQWQRLAFYHENIYARIDPKPKSSISEKLASPRCLMTKAAAILEGMHGPCLELEVSEISKKRGRKAKVNNEERMFRCECLEPVWPSRHHCLSCHQTFSLFQDFEGHNDGKCATSSAADESNEIDDQMKGKGIRSDNTKGKEHSDDGDTVEASKRGKFDISSRLDKFPKKACPYALAEISKIFITNDSNKELVKEIGLIGSNEVPSLISSAPLLFDPPRILKRSKKFTHLSKVLPSSDNQSLNSVQNEGASVSYGLIGNKPKNETKLTQNCLGDSERDRLAETPSVNVATVKHASLRLQPSKVIRSCKILEPSLRPLLGKVSHILERLKINLLDMEAALPEEALRPSKSHSTRRCAWRAFVKYAESIFEVSRIPLSNLVCYFILLFFLFITMNSFIVYLL